MKNLTIFLVFIIGVNSFSQESVDVGSPADSGFQLGSDIQGTIQNSVNEATGKVTLSVPLASIAANSISFGASLTYNGQTSFKNGQQTNKYNPTSVVGVGWSMGVPKILVDHKSTGTRDDDDFYILDGATNSKLICINKEETSSNSVWEFQMEKYAPWLIKYHRGFYEPVETYPNNWVNVYKKSDYWSIVKEDGKTYYFGYSDNSPYINPEPSATSKSKEKVIAWGNWIGDSNQSGGSEHTVVWNLSRISDQWFNKIDFEYDLVERLQSGVYKQTEASYLKSVSSSNGANIQLIYDNKLPIEYYEPHQETLEPDAYQERYEQKYLQSVSSYNNENQLVSTIDIEYNLQGSILDGTSKKRYLTSLTKTAFNKGVSETLPAQTFDYYYTGIFKGGLKKINYPTGGSVTYNYVNKHLFNNTVNKFSSSLVWPLGYDVYSRVVKNNYTLYVLRSVNPVTGSKYRFKFFRLWWNGEEWEHNEFTFPHLIDDQPSERLKDFYVVLENNFYSFVYDKGTTADMYFFHQKSDGRTWHEYTSTNKTINGTPYFMSGNDFVGLGSRNNGALYTYVWNGLSWNYKLINQGSGEYFMAANNNFIISLDERDDSDGVDMVTGLTHSDYYYMHYLDAEKKWQTKSWSAAADPYIKDVWIANTSPGYASFYPDNSIAGFVAKDNPELFLRWDTNYNLTSVDDKLGEFNDLSPMLSVANSMFTIYSPTSNIPYKCARFNGIDWEVETPSPPEYGHAYLQFGIDLFSYRNSLRSNNNPSTSDCKIYSYDPNTNSWSNTILYAPNNHYNNAYNPINLDFMVIGNKFFNKSNQGTNPLFSQIGSLNSDNVFAYSTGLNHTYVQENFNNGRFYYIDKNDEQLKYVQQYQVFDRYKNLSKIFGGYTPFMSPSALCLVETANSSMLQLPDVYLYKIINDGVSNSVNSVNSVSDIVVNHIDINDDNGNLRRVQYTYNKPKSTPDNSTTFYGEVVIKNKGIGTGNIGKVIKKFNDGSEDLTMVGLPIEVIVTDANNTLVKKTTMTWNKYSKYHSNGSSVFYNSYYIRSTKEKEELYFNGSPTVVSETINTYNTYGLKTSSYSTNSKGEQVHQDISYAYEHYTFVNDKNMLSFPYRITSKINGEIVNVKETKWLNDNGKVYIIETWSGPSASNLRLNSKISKVEQGTGNVLENNNGKGLYNAVLFGYDDLYEVATISNAKHEDVVNQLDVSYAQLQNLSTTSLKTELLKLYDRLPNASVTLTFFDDNGRVISRVNERKEESFVYYDTVGRQDYITDAQGNILEKKSYHF